MSAGNYPYVPTKPERQVLAVLAAAQIFMPPMTPYNGFLFEDIKARTPKGVKRRDIGRALYNLDNAGYIKMGATHLLTDEGTAITQTWEITAKGLRVTLGVLG